MGIPGCERRHCFHAYRLFQRVIHGKRVKRPEACGWPNADAELVPAHSAHIERDDPILGYERAGARQEPPYLPSRWFFDVDLECVQLFLQFPGEKLVPCSGAFVDDPIPSAHVTAAEFDHLLDHVGTPKTRR